METTSFAELRAGCDDIDERVKDMDANGVLGSLCFPSFPQFCGQLFARTEPCSRGRTAPRRRPASTPTRCTSRSGSWPASRRSTFP